MSISRKKKLVKQMKDMGLKDYEHRNCINMMIKAIWVSPLNDQVKILMIQRIWGKSPKFFYPLTLKQIAADFLGHVPDAHEYKAFEELERFGRDQMEEFVNNMSNQEIIDRYNEDFQKNKGHIFSNETFGKKRFKI